MSFLKNLFGPPDIPKLKQEGNVGGLLKALGHTSWHVRRDAAVALGKLGDRRVVSPLLGPVPALLVSESPRGATS